MPAQQIKHMDGDVITSTYTPAVKLAVRLAGKDDVTDIMDLALLGCEENAFVNADNSKILADIWTALTTPWGLVGVIGPRGKPEAAVLLRIFEPWYSKSLVMEERAIFVHPDYRAVKGGRASRLVEFSKMAADRMGMPLLIGVLSNNRTAAKVRLYERHFGKMAGAYFIYGAHTGGAAVEFPTTDG